MTGYHYCSDYVSSKLYVWQQFF